MTTLPPETLKMKPLPSEQWCREKLRLLLDRVSGDKQHAIVIGFWRERAEALNKGSEEEKNYSTELFVRLEKVWDELTNEEDVFGVFGV
ncbi:MAG: hypothetical protein KGI50_07375 [Patescibacteria group bacterium]|nr:hypothetical protein [Patescibacteria group bacterium]